MINFLLFAILLALTLLILGALRIAKLLEKIMASQSEEAAKLNAIADQLDKATTEIKDAFQALKDALAAAGSTTADVDAATTRLGGGIQVLDDLNPDAPASTP